ncbi:MAG TPA: amidase domain-containing protein, partial [Agromyces sp.]|nr:amidase domain-containing protein [Agromyces sp.]
PAVAAQLEYVHNHWRSTSSERFGFVDENDCVNFTSQSLLARGWQTDEEWWYSDDGDPWSHPTAWISSTSFMEYLEEHPERATALTDDQRDQVKVGDVVQFDWDDSGDRDHTGIVTSVTTESDGSISILYAGHTDATGTARSTGRSPSTTLAAWRTTGASPSSERAAASALLVRECGVERRGRQRPSLTPDLGLPAAPTGTRIPRRLGSGDPPLPAITRRSDREARPTYATFVRRSHLESWEQHGALGCHSRCGRVDERRRCAADGGGRAHGTG